MKRYEHRMARALATVVNMLDPDVIVLGGGLSNVERLYVNVPPILARYVFAAESQPAGAPEEGRSTMHTASALTTRMVRARHGDASGVRGAAWLWRSDE